MACACAGAAPSVQVCGNNGTLGPCACPDAGSVVDAGADAGLDLGQSVDAGEDRPATVDAGFDTSTAADRGVADVPPDLADAGPFDASSCGRCEAPNVQRALCGMDPERGSFCFAADCVPGSADCNRDFADGCETDIRSSIGSCGACGRVCSGGRVCFNYECVADAGFATFPADVERRDIPRGDALPSECRDPTQSCTSDADCAMCAPIRGVGWCCGPGGSCSTRFTDGACLGWGHPDAGPTVNCSERELSCSSSAECAALCAPPARTGAWCCSLTSRRCGIRPNGC